MAFKPGNNANPGGGKKGNKGGGRTPEALKILCKNILEKRKLIEKLGDIASGDPIVPALGAFGPIKDKKGNQVYVAAPIKTQVEAIFGLMDRGYGKPTQQVESSSFDEVIEMMRKRYA